VRYLALLSLLAFSFQSFAIEKLRLIAEQNMPTGEKFKETEIGGLSGIVYDAKKNRLLATSDDRSQVNDARFYEFEFKLNEKNFSVKLVDVVIVKDKDGKPFKKMTTDFEGISFWGDDILISSEGGINKMPPINPGVFRFSRDGKYKENLEVPEKFLVMKGFEMNSGARDNLAFEALSTTKDGKFVFVGMEESLVQDGRISSHIAGSTTRIILYNNLLKPIKEFGYTLEKVPSISVAGLIVGQTGLVDIAAIDENNFYSMERSYMPLARKTVIRIFSNHIDSETTDISQMDNILKKKINTITKTQLSNIEEDMGIKPDNVEGLCFGPLLSNGHQTLIAVSDNNFSKNQKTEFLAFEIIP
jgi:hypothetical protein